MTDPKVTEPEPEGTDPDDVDVDIDLLADDAMLREALQEPTSIRLPTGDVIDIPHMSDWPHVATRYMAQGLFDAWAEEVLTPDEYKSWKEADLHNYQIEKITAAVSAAGGTTAGKRRPSSSSQRSKRRR